MASSAGINSKSSYVLDAVISARKRKRSKAGGHSSASDSSTSRSNRRYVNVSLRLLIGPTRVKKPIRRQTRPKTSVTTYARDESLRIERELKQIDKIL